MASVETGKLWGGQKLGAYLATAALIGWMVAMITIQFVQAHQHGYGSGFGDGGRVPPAVVQMYGTDDPQELVQKTMGEGTQAQHNPFEGGWTR